MHLVYNKPVSLVQADAGDNYNSTFFTDLLMQKLISIFFALTALALSPAAIAHHSFSAEFDAGKPVELTGTVTHIEWTNPHAWVHLDVTDDKGNIENWSVELLGVNALVHSGMTPRTVKPGDVLTIKGFAARDGSNTANGSLVTRTKTGEKLWGSARENRD